MKKTKKVSNAVQLIIAYGNQQKEFTLTEQPESEYLPSINLEKMTLEFIKNGEKKSFAYLCLHEIVSSRTIKTSVCNKKGMMVEQSNERYLGYAPGLSVGNFHLIVYVKAIRFNQGEYDSNNWNKNIFSDEHVFRHLLWINKQKAAVQIKINGKLGIRNAIFTYDMIIDTKNGYSWTESLEMALTGDQKENFGLLVDRISTGEETITLKELAGNQKEHILKRGKTLKIIMLGHQKIELKFLDFMPKMELHEWDL